MPSTMSERSEEVIVVNVVRGSGCENRRPGRRSRFLTYPVSDPGSYDPGSEWVGHQLRSLRGMRSADMPESVDVVVVLVDEEVLGYVLDEVVVLGVLDVLGVLLDVVLLVPVPLIVLELDGALDEVLGFIFDVSELLPVMLPRVPAPAAAPALVPPGLPPWSPVPAVPVVCA
jgi:hypothetical protein